MEEQKDNQKKAFAQKSGELETLKLRRETIQKSITETTPRWAQIMVIAGCLISATGYGIIFGVGPALIIVGAVYWSKTNKKRKELEDELVSTETRMGKLSAELIELQG